MRIIVTGGAGFIGRHLVAALREQGHDVLSIDPAGPDLTGTDVRSLVEHWHDGSHLRSIDFIYHLGGPVGTFGVVLDRGSVAGRILAAAQAVADLADYHDARVVNVSTSEVYGRTGESTEQESCIVPPHHSARLAYATGKLAAENDLHTSGIQVRTVRPFNVAGPGQQAATGFVLPRWCMAALRGEPIQVFGSGSLERSFCHVTDFVGALLAYLPGDVFRAAPPVVNIGNPANRSSIIDLAFTFMSLTTRELGEPVLMEQVDGRDVFGSGWEEAAGGTKLPVIDKARTFLHWEPQLPLHRVILDTLQYERAAFVRPVA